MKWKAVIKTNNGQMVTTIKWMKKDNASELIHLEFVTWNCFKFCGDGDGAVDVGQMFKWTERKRIINVAKVPNMSAELIMDIDFLGIEHNKPKNLFKYFFRRLNFCFTTHFHTPNRITLKIA